MSNPLRDLHAQPLASTALALAGSAGWESSHRGADVPLDAAAQRLCGQDCAAVPAPLGWADLGDAADAWRQTMLPALREGGRLPVAVPEAPRSLAEAMPDIARPDRVLPGAGGGEVLRHLRRGGASGGNRGPACAVGSSVVDPEAREWLMAAGTDGCQRKPMRLQQLPDRLPGPRSGGAHVWHAA